MTADKTEPMPEISQALLDEVVAFTQLVLQDLKRGTITPERTNPAVHTVRLQCVPPDMAAGELAPYHRQGWMIHMGLYPTAHPATVEAFHGAVLRLLEKSGCTPVMKRRFSSFRENECSLNLTRSTINLNSFSVSCHAPPEKIRAALATDTVTLRDICFSSLVDALETVRKLEAALGKSGIDIRTFNGVASAEPPQPVTPHRIIPLHPGQGKQQGKQP